jgi:polyhydroxybutyrate depolymerase
MELTAGGRVRRFALHPPRSRSSGGTPLVIVLHGNHPDATGLMMRDWTTFDEQADAFGFAVAYPDGVGGCWADGRGVTTADEAGVDDVAFLRALVGTSAERYGTFADRAVVAGVSNGAFMAHRMAIEASDQVAVFGAVAGGLPASLCDTRPAHAVSAVLIHGTADRVSPIEGGYSRHRGTHGELRGRTLSLDETAGFWRAVDGSRPVPAPRAPPSSRAGTPQKAAPAGRGWPPGQCSGAATPGPAPGRSPGPPRQAPGSSTPPRRSAASPGRCSRPPRAGGFNAPSLVLGARCRGAAIVAIAKAAESGP